MKILLMGNTTTEHNSYKELFLELSNKGYIIESVEDGIITAKLKEETQELKFAEVKTDNTKENLIKDISEHRDSMREVTMDLKKQGIMSDESIKALAEQFKFLKVK